MLYFPPPEPPPPVVRVAEVQPVSAHTPAKRSSVINGNGKQALQKDPRSLSERMSDRAIARQSVDLSEPESQFYPTTFSPNVVTAQTEDSITEEEDGDSSTVGSDSPDPPPDPAEVVPSETGAESAEPDEDEAAATETVPRAVRPEPDWSNGAVTDEGVLLPPSQPTNRPPVPLSLTADYQEFEPLSQVVTARGDVVLRLGNGILSADKLWANLLNRYVLVEGNVVFTRGSQTIEAERGEYNLIQGQGSLFDARGTVFLPSIDTDFAEVLPNDATTATSGPVTNLIREGPVRDVRGTGNITFGAGIRAGSESAGVSDSDLGGFVRRLRFEAERVDFDAEGLYAQEIRLTNDPFSPPELEFRGNSAQLTRVSEFEDELRIENPRLVFDQSFSVPLLRSTFLLRRGSPEESSPFFVAVGYDGDDRDGLFVERSFRVVTADPWEFTLTPQLLVQRFAVDQDDDFLSNFGLEADLEGRLGPTTAVQANASFSGLDFDNLEDRLRSSVRVQQALGTHSLNLEYSYRDRLFNGSLGFQDVQSSLGAVLISPSIVLGNTGIILNYQASAQYVTADTDQRDLLDPFEVEDLVSLGRFQGSVSLARGFSLWQGTPLPPTRDEGLRFTPVPRTPNIQLIVGGRGTYTYYTSADTQESLVASITLAGELGHFSDDFFDSTVFNISYRRSFLGEGNSPFLFDRDADQNVLSGGILQQIYGPFRVGFQTAVNLDTGEIINTDLAFEYSRRTYGIVARFNPTQATGFIGFRLSEFDWSGRAARFGGADIDQVDGGVIR